MYSGDNLAFLLCINGIVRFRLGVNASIEERNKRLTEHLAFAEIPLKEKIVETVSFASCLAAFIMIHFGSCF